MTWTPPPDVVEETDRRFWDGMFQDRVARRIGAFVGSPVRRARLLAGDPLEDLLEQAVADGVLSEQQSLTLFWPGLVARGLREGEPVLLAVRAAQEISAELVRAAVDDAALLARTGTPALAVVAGRTITAEAHHLAVELRVVEAFDADWREDHGLPRDTPAQE